MLAKVSKNAQAEVKADYWAIFDLPEDVEPGLDAVKMAQGRIDAFAKRWRDSYPAAVRSLLTDRDSLTVFLRFPREHWNRMRHCNFNRMHLWRNPQVIGRLPGEHSCLSLVWAGARPGLGGLPGFTMTPAWLRLLQDLRRTLHDPRTGYRNGIRHDRSKTMSHQPNPPPSMMPAAARSSRSPASGRCWRRCWSPRSGMCTASPDRPS